MAPAAAVLERFERKENVMLTISIPGVPHPCTSKSLVASMIGAMNRDQCRELYGAVHPDDGELRLLLIERLGILADGY